MQQVIYSSSSHSSDFLMSIGINLDDPIIGSFFHNIRGVYGSERQFPYHNFDGHVLSVVALANGIADRVEAAGTPVNRRVLTLAALGHDALFDMVPAFYQCNNSEQVASRYSQQLLKQLGLDEAEVRAVGQAIEASNHSVQPRSIEARILRAADLSTVAGPYEIFRKNTEALFAESLARGVGNPFPKFANGSLRYLALYMADLITLTPHSRDESGRSVWHTAAMRNIGRLFRETFPLASIQLVVRETQIHNSGGELRNSESPRLIIEVVDEHLIVDPQHRLSMDSAYSGEDIKMKIPGSPKAFPLPDGFCDDVFVGYLGLEMIPELARVCRPRGVVHVRLGTECGLQETVAAFQRFELNAVSGTSDQLGNILTFSRDKIAPAS